MRNLRFFSSVAVLFLMAASQRVHSGTPPEGTSFTFSVPRGSGFVFSAYEEDAGCINHLVHYTHPLVLEAAVPVYLSQRPGVVRLFVLGSAGSARELWLGQDTPTFNHRLPFNDVASVTPYSDNEALVAERNGTLSVVDGNGKALWTFSIAGFFPTHFKIGDIGQTLRAWRTGPHSFGVLTENHFVHFDGTDRTLIILNDTPTLAPDAFRASFDLSTLRTANGDRDHVWIVHETLPRSPLSFSLFEIQTGKLVQRHVCPAKLFGPSPAPVYHDTPAARSYFSMGDDLISVTETNFHLESPQSQLNATALRLMLPGNTNRFVSTPPVQGDPWASSNQHWRTPAPSRRSGQGWLTLLTRPVISNPSVSTSVRTPSSQTSSGGGASTGKKDILGAERTKAELTTYLAQALAPALVAGQVDSGMLVRVFSRLPQPVRMGILDLPDAFLRPRGVEYLNGALGFRASQKSVISEWVDAIWARG